MKVLRCEMVNVYCKFRSRRKIFHLKFVNTVRQNTVVGDKFFKYFNLPIILNRPSDNLTLFRLLAKGIMTKIKSDLLYRDKK